MSVSLPDNPPHHEAHSFEKTCSMAEQIPVGAADAGRVGWNVGVGDGTRDGCAVGCSVDATDGCCVGSVEGR